MSEKRIVGVQFRNSKLADTSGYGEEHFSGREYNYFTAIDLQVGDFVMVPTSKGESVAKVASVNISESEIDERVLPLLKTIVKKYEPVEKPVFYNPVYEQQRKNIEALYEESPDDWFYKSQMEMTPERRTGFAPRTPVCYHCRKDITQGERGITLESLGSYIITGCPHCNRSYCD